MTKFVVTGALCEIGAPEKIRLTDQQAADRSFGVKKLKRGLYQATMPLQFKKGEVIDLPDGCPKGLANILTSEAELKKKAKAQQDAAAKQAKQTAKQDAAAAKAAQERDVAIAKRHAELVAEYEGDKDDTLLFNGEAAKAQFKTADAYADAVLTEEFPA